MNFDNRRSEPRINDRLTVFVEVRAADPDANELAEILVCSGADLSANGVRLEVDRELVVGSILRLGAAPPDGIPVMYVVGEVRWCRPAPRGFETGFAFFDSEGTDIINWKEFVAGRLGA